MTVSATVSPELLFRDWFLPLYPEDAKNDLGRARATDANPANNPAVLAHLGEAAERFAELAPEALGVPASELALDFSDASIHRLSAALTPASRDRLMASGARGSGDSALFNVVVHGAAYVGACVVREHGGRWAVRRPLWESLVYLRSRAGEAHLPVFHWWLKSLSDAPEAGKVATLADRYRAHVEVTTAKPEALPIIAPPDRRLPKLSKVRYDALYKYLRAHLPELRDVGEHFPSPERFEELKFDSLSFLLVGAGRMLILAGHNADGLHAFWLTKEGFEKSAFWPADTFPAPILRVQESRGDAADQKLEVVLSQGGEMRSFELLWWGP